MTFSRKNCADFGKPNLWRRCVDYNYLFRPNVCHVCKSSNNDDLISCKNCYMISYCCDEHKSQHHSKHLEFCQLLKQYLEKNYGKDWRYVSWTTTEWKDTRGKIAWGIAQQLKRNMQQYEVEMIYFAKSCRICHQQANLRACSACHSDNYCDNHVREFRVRHVSKCRNLELCLNVDILNIMHDEFPKVMNRFPDREKYFYNMNSFLINFVREDHLRYSANRTNKEYLYSNYASGPLMLYDAMKNTDLFDLSESEYVVHVINATCSEKLNVRAWEILLHCLRSIKKLTIILIGKQLQDEMNRIKTCSRCLNNNQRLGYVCHNLWYHNYVDSPLFRQPDVIVGFGANFAYQTWVKSLLASQHISRPYVLTSTSQCRAEKNVNKIEELLNINPSYNKPNKFGTLMPSIIFGTDDTCYTDSYVTIYRDLFSSDAI